MSNMKWVKHTVDDDEYWDLVDTDTYIKGDHEAWAICYRDHSDTQWYVMYDDSRFDLDDDHVSKEKFPTYQRLRKHLWMQYLLLRKDT